MVSKNYLRLFAFYFATAILFVSNALNAETINYRFNSNGIKADAVTKESKTNLLPPLVAVIVQTGNNIPCCNSGAIGNTCLCFLCADQSGGQGPFTYTWSNGQTMKCATGLCDGVYTVTVTDITGATSTVSAMVGGHCCKLNCKDTMICYDIPDSAVHLKKPPYGDSSSTSGQPSYCTYDSIWTNFNGVYNVGPNYVKWYVRANGVLDSCTQNVIRKPPSVYSIKFGTTPPMIAGVINICNGQSITFTDSSTGTTGRLWNFGNGYYSSNAVHTEPASHYPPGTYFDTLRVYDDCGNPHDSAFTVVVDPSSGPDIECISVVCAGDTSTYSTHAVCTTYNWVVTGGTIITPPTYGSTIQVVWGPGPKGTISLSVSGCTPPSTCPTPTVKTVNIVPSVMKIVGDTVTCQGSTTCYAVECIPGNTHIWELMPSNAGVITGQGTCSICIKWDTAFVGQATIQLNYHNALTGSGCNLPVGCANDAGCGGIGIIHVNVKPVFKIAGPAKVCQGSVSAPFTSNASPTTWKLIPPYPPFTPIVFGSTAAFNTFTWDSLGTYQIIAIAPPNIFCNDTAKLLVEVVGVKIPSIISGQDTVCDSVLYYYSVVPNQNNVQYVWNVVGGTPSGTTITPTGSLGIKWGPGGGTVSVQQQLASSPFCLSASSATFIVKTWPNFVLPALHGDSVTCNKATITYYFTPPALLSNATYTWSIVPSSMGSIVSANGLNQITIKWNNSGAASVKLKISRCYEDSVSWPIVINPLPPVPSITTNSPVCIGNPMSFSTTSLGPLYNWNFGDLGTASTASASHTYATPGDFNVTLYVTNIFGCSDTAHTVAHVDDKPVLPIITGPSSSCINDIKTYTFSQPFFPGASYIWSVTSGAILSGQGTNSINVKWTSAPATGTVNLSILSNCPVGPAATFNVIINPLPVPIIGVPSPLCMGAPLTFTGSGGPSYSWSFPGASSVNLANPAAPVVVYNIDGTYSATLTVTDANGCSATTTQIYQVHELPIAFITTPDPDGCQFPYPINVYAVNSGGYSFSWIPTGTSGPVLSTVVAATTTYSVLVTNQYGCTKMSNAITFTDGNCPPGAPQPGDCASSDSINFTWSPPLCLSATFTASGSVLPVPALSWFYDYAGATGTGNPTSFTYTFPGFYKVKVCGEGRGFLFGIVPPQPCPNVTICKMRPVKIPFDARFKVSFACNGSNQMQTIITNTSIWAGANSYVWNWYLDGSLIPFSSVTNPPSQLFSVGPHNITLIISDPGVGNTLATCTLTVAINVPAPIVASFTPPASVCTGFAAAFIDTSTPAAFSRTWTSAGAASTTTNPANLIYTSGGATTVTLNVSDSYGCTSSASAPYTVGVGAGTLTVGPNPNCDSVMLTASGNPNYVWTNFSPVPSVLASTVYVKTSGYYSVTAIDPSNNCPYSASTGLITVKQPLVATITGKIQYCQGENLDLKTSSAGISVVWKYDFDGYVSTQGTLPNLNNVASIPGTFIYRVTVTAANGCTSTASITIVVDPVPASASIVITGTNPLCEGDSVKLTVTPGTGVTYLWSKSPTPALTPPANANPVLYAKTSGTYSVIVLTASGCPFPAIAPVLITVNPKPVANITGDTVLCVGETLQLQTLPVGGATYAWTGPVATGTSNPFIVPNIQLTDAGLYTVVVTNQYGCTASDQTTVIVHPNPTTPVITSTPGGTLCEGILYSFIASPVPIIPIYYLWNTGQMGDSIHQAKAGDYYVTAYNQFGCSATSNILTICPLPDLSCAPSGCYDFCSECTTVTIPGPNGLAFYQWQKLVGGVFVNYSNTQNITISVPGGKFRLLGYNSCGCSDSSDTLKVDFHNCCQPTDTVACVDTTCQDFSIVALNFFGPYPPAPNVNIVVSNVGGQYAGDKFLKVTDLPGLSAIKTDSTYNGKWCCGTFCYDFKIFDDGQPGVVNLQPKFRIFNSVTGKGFVFTSSLTMNETSGWKRIIACAGLDSLPVNPTYGTWAPIAGTTVADWNSVASNVTDVVIQTQIGDNGEIVGIDNVCFIPLHFVIGCHQTTVCGGHNLGVDIIDEGGCPNFKYLWSNGATTHNIIVSTPGTYCVTVSNCCGCVDSCCLVVVADTIEIIHVTDTVYHINCDSIFGGITVNVGGGVSPYTAVLSDGTALTAVAGTSTYSVFGLAAGNYTVTVTDSVGCVVIIHDTVVIDTTCNCATTPAPTITIIGVDADSCNQSGCIHATFTGCCLRYSYSYTPLCSTDFPYSVAQTTNPAIFCHLKAGYYTIYVQDMCGHLVSQTVTVPGINGPLAVTTHFSNCADSICLEVTGGCPPYTYQWLGGATTQCITGFPPCTDFYCTVTDSRGCTFLQYVTGPHVNFYNIVKPHCCAANGSICVEACFAQMPYTYQWSTLPVQTTACATGLVAGTYCVTITNATGQQIHCCYTLTGENETGPDVTFEYAGCGSEITPIIHQSNCSNYTYYWDNGSTNLTRGNLTGCDSITFTIVLCDGTVIHHGLRVPHITAVTTAAQCAGGEGTICVNVECLRCPPYTYSWLGNPVCPGSTTNCLSCVAGTYTVCITNSCGETICCPFTILPSIPLTVTTHFSECADSICLEVQGGYPPYTYQWLGGATTQCITGFPPCTDFYCTVTDSHGCTYLQFVTGPHIGFNNIIKPHCCAANGSLCAQVCFGQMPYSYQWNTNPVQTTQCATGLVAGTYCVTVTNANGQQIHCCYTLTGEIETGPDVTFEYAACGSEITPIIHQSNCTNYTYHWDNGSTNLTRGNLKGCDSITFTIVLCDGTVIHHGLRVPHVSAVITGATCLQGSLGSICVNIECLRCPPYTYSWLGNAVCPGSTTNCFSCIPGTYTVCITNSCGETICCPFTIPSSPVIIPNCSVIKNVTCFGGHDGVARVTASGGTPTFTYLWSNGSTNSTIGNLPAGTYCVTITDANGCTATCCCTVTQPTTVVVVSTATTNVICKGQNTGTAILTVSGGSGTYTYLWSDGVTTQNRNNLYAGIYTVTISDGCTTVIKTITITQPQNGMMLTATKANPKCFGTATGSVTVTVSGAILPVSYLWSNGKTTATITGLTAGVYTVIVSDGSPCTLSLIAILTNPPALTISTSGTNPTNGLSNGTATVTASGGTPAYTYLWNTIPARTTATITGLAAGVYNIRVTDSKGCYVNGSVTLAAARMLAINAQQDLNLFVLPNPNDGQFMLYLNSDFDAKATVELLDYTSRLVTTQHINVSSGENQLVMNFSTLAKGIYTIKVNYNGLTKYCRFVVQ